MVPSTDPNLPSLDLSQLDLKRDLNDKIREIAAQVLFTLTTVATIGFGIAFFACPLSWAAGGIGLAALMVSFAVSSFLLPVLESQDFVFSSSSYVSSSSPSKSSNNLQELEKLLGPKLKRFLVLYRNLESSQLALGNELFSPTYKRAMEIAAEIKKDFGDDWAESILTILSSDADAILPQNPKIAEDTKMASQEEVKAAGLGLVNPSCNCFMNASIQALFQDDAVAAHILAQLNTIKDNAAFEINPSINPEIKITIPKALNLSDEEQAVYQAGQIDKKDAYLEEFDKANKESVASYQEGQINKKDAGLKTSDKENKKSVASFKLQDLKDFKDDYIQRIYLSISLKQAAEYAHSILTKWKAGTAISSDEAKILRLSLIKLMNKRPKLEIIHGGTKEKPVERKVWTIPGLNGDYINIYHSRQEESSEFTREIIDSLDELTQTFNPLRINVQQKREGFRPSADGQDAFDPELKIEGAEKTTVIKYTSLQVTRSFDKKYHLDDVALFNEFKTVKKPKDEYKKAHETLPNTKVGDRVSEQTTFEVTLPETLSMWIQASDAGNRKHPKVELSFTNEENLSITLPVHEATRAEKTYELASFTLHSGQSVKSGHYYTYTRKKRENGESYWIKQDDSSISAANINEVKHLLKGSFLNKSANMLIFKAV